VIEISPILIGQPFLCGIGAGILPLYRPFYKNGHGTPTEIRS